MIAASLLLASWVMVLRPLFRSGGDNLLSQAISLAYPIGDVVVGTIVLFVLARARMGQRHPGDPAAPARRRAGGHRRGRQRLRVPHRQRLLLVGGADRRRLVPRLPAGPAGRPQAGGRGGRRGGVRHQRRPHGDVPALHRRRRVAGGQHGGPGPAGHPRLLRLLDQVLHHRRPGRAPGAEPARELLAGPAPGGAGHRADGRAAGQRAALPGAGPAQLRGRDPGRPRRQGRVRQRVDDQGVRLQRGPPARPAAHPDPRLRATGSACARAWPRWPSGPTACSSWSCRCATATATGAPSSSPSPTCSTTPASAAWS